MRYFKMLVLSLAVTAFGTAVWSQRAEACTTCKTYKTCDDGDFAWCFVFVIEGETFCNFGGECPPSEEELALSDVSPTGFFASDEVIEDRVSGLFTSGCSGLAVGLLPDEPMEFSPKAIT